MNSPIVRCNRCQNIVLADLEHCPECGCRTARGWRALRVQLLAVLLILIVLALIGYMLLESRLGN